MKKAELEHLLRAAGGVARDQHFIVFVSQAIWGLVRNVPRELTKSMEADIYPRTYPQAVRLIEETLGRSSRFYRTYRYYADYVTPDLATFPNEWEKRLVPFKTKNTGGVTGWCVEIHDLAISKLAAGREKDLAYIRALLKHKLVKRTILEERLADTAIHPHHREELLETLRKLARPKANRK
jgi:hypothetical protein